MIDASIALVSAKRVRVGTTGDLEVNKVRVDCDTAGVCPVPQSS